MQLCLVRHDPGPCPTVFELNAVLVIDVPKIVVEGGGGGGWAVLKWFSVRLLMKLF